MCWCVVKKLLTHSRSTVGAVKTVRSLTNGDFLLEVTSAVQGRIVNKLDNLAGCPVTASPQRTLNTCKGVIRCAPLVDCDKDQTLKQLKPQGVSDITNITVKHDSYSRKNTNTFIITFKAPTIPKYLHVGYLRVPVSTYIPNPLCCFKCQKFGHGKNACRGRETYATCGQIGHTSSDCTNEPKCPNCTGNHSAFSKSCPVLFCVRTRLQIWCQLLTCIKAVRLPEPHLNGDLCDYFSHLLQQVTYRWLTYTRECVIVSVSDA